MSKYSVLMMVYFAFTQAITSMEKIIIDATEGMEEFYCRNYIAPRQFQN
jgi:hypothetical protein